MDKQFMRIGNLVHKTWADNSCTDPLLVKEIKTEKDIEDAYWWVGISITAYWLLEFGFTKFYETPTLQCFFIDMGSKEMHITIGQQFPYIEIMGSEGDEQNVYQGENFQYVHELQNLYWALTEKDLVIKQI